MTGQHPIRSVGNPETTTGGNALKFYASVRLHIRKIGVVKNGEQVVCNRTRVKVVKNKVAPPFVSQPPISAAAVTIRQRHSRRRDLLP